MNASAPSWAVLALLGALHGVLALLAYGFGHLILFRMMPALFAEPAGLAATLLIALALAMLVGVLLLLPSMAQGGAAYFVGWNFNAAGERLSGTPLATAAGIYVVIAVAAAVWVPAVPQVGLIIAGDEDAARAPFLVAAAVVASAVVNAQIARVAARAARETAERIAARRSGR